MLSTMRKTSVLKLGAGMVVAVVAVVAAGFWYFFVRDDSPERAALVDRPAVNSPDGAERASPDGSWSVTVGQETFAGFRISEHFPGFDNTAVVRTASVEGSLTVAGQEISDVTVTADLTALESKDAQPPGAPGIENRVSQLRNDGLETDEFPTATFTLTAPIRLADPPAVDEAVAAEAEGDLTIHGQTRPVMIPVQARWNGELIDVAGSLEVAMADYGMTPPNRPFVTVDEVGTMEFQLTFAR